MAGARLGRVANMPAEAELVAARDKMMRPRGRENREEGRSWVNGSGWWSGRKR
jgi:hypothetical protein